MRSINNQRGSILLSALALAVVIAVMVGTIASQVKHTNEMSSYPKIRSQMAQLEMQVRSLALSPKGYTGCDSTVGATGTSLNNCAINSTAFTSLSTVTCTAGQPCPAHIAVMGAPSAGSYAPAPTLSQITSGSGTAQANGYNVSNWHVQASLVYIPATDAQGNKLGADAMVNIQRNLDIQIPAEVLQSTSFICPATTPFFDGYATDGSIICSALRGTRCPAGQYVTAIDPMTLTWTCQNAGALITCDTADHSQMITHIEWDGTTQVGTPNCAQRPDIYEDFSPSLVVDSSAPPSAPVTCPATNESWSVGSNICTGSVSQQSVGGTSTATSTGANTGSATYVCSSSGAWNGPSGASCAAAPSQTYSWSPEAWGACSGGNQTRVVDCVSSTGTTADPSMCASSGPEPATSQACCHCGVSPVSWTSGNPGKTTTCINTPLSPFQPPFIYQDMTIGQQIPLQAAYVGWDDMVGGGGSGGYGNATLECQAGNMCTTINTSCNRGLPQ